MCLTCAERVTLGYYIIHIALTFFIFIYGVLIIRRKDRRDKERRVEEERRYKERCVEEERRDKARRVEEERRYKERRVEEDRRDKERRVEKDRRDKERRVEEDRRDKERRVEEDRRNHKRREWRQFSEKINADYSKLKSKDILRKISKVKNTFEHMRIHSTVTGLDVLRYMLTDDNYRNLVSKSPHLQALREDLHMIFLPLNVCSSLLHLGEVPINIKEELRFVVEELGNLAKPFLTGEQQRVALKCLEHFCSNRSSNEHGQRGVEGLGVRIKAIVPYVNSLQFISMEDCDYSKCKKFSFNFKE